MQEIKKLRQLIVDMDNHVEKCHRCFNYAPRTLRKRIDAVRTAHGERANND